MLLIVFCVFLLECVLFDNKDGVVLFIWSYLYAKCIGRGRVLEEERLGRCLQFFGARFFLEIRALSRGMLWE